MVKIPGQDHGSGNNGPGKTTPSGFICSRFQVISRILFNQHDCEIEVKVIIFKGIEEKPPA
jgi:hypothetical protein